MLRFLYSAVLRAHPPYFRQRFSDEMQAIFDQADTELTKARLLADAAFSLVRQWTSAPPVLGRAGAHCGRGGNGTLFVAGQFEAANRGSLLRCNPLGSGSERRVVDDWLRLGASHLHRDPAADHRSARCLESRALS